jgi:magnesium transporter
MDEPSPSMPSSRGTRRAVRCLDNDSAASVASVVGESTYVWVNLEGATQDQITQAGSSLGLHPLSIEDLEHFNQRAKVEDYGSYMHIVAFGATLDETDDDRLVEVHVIYSPDFLMTVSQERADGLSSFQQTAAGDKFSGHELLHAVLNRLIDSYAPLLDRFDSEIEALEEEIVDRRLRGRELAIHELRRRLSRVDRSVHRQLEAFTTIRENLRRLPDHEYDDFPYFRDLQDHLAHVADSADAMRERIAGLFELYMAALDNRQNIIMKQFTVISAIFLPLSVLTGFFGMNFGWMVRHIDSPHAFMLLGVALPVAILCILILTLASRGLFRD